MCLPLAGYGRELIRIKELGKDSEGRRKRDGRGAKEDLGTGNEGG